MQNEAFFHKLKQTLESLFIGRKSLQDDTFLEKLRTLLTELFSSETTKCATIEVIEDVRWIDTLADISNSSLDSRTIAFGLHLIGNLFLIPECHQMVRKHEKILKTLLGDVVGHLKSFDASVRYAALKMLQLCLTSTLQNVSILDLDIANVVRCTSVDSSVFVVRASKEFTLDYLILNIREPNEDKNSDPVLTWLVDAMKLSENESSRKHTLFAVDVFQELAFKNILTMEIISKQTDLKSEVDQCVWNFTDDEELCSACCSLLISANLCRFEEGDANAEWTKILDLLFSRNQLITATKFILNVIKKICQNQQHIPDELKSLIVAPLFVCFKWNSSTHNWDKVCTSKWVCHLQRNPDSNGIIRLCSYILGNVSSFHQCFSETETFELLNLMLRSLLETNSLVLASQKIQTAIVSASRILLEKSLGTNAYHTLEIEQLEQTWTNVINVVEEPSPSAMVSVRRMEMLCIVLQNTETATLSQLINTCSRLNRLLQKKLYDVNWEVRDTAIEIIREIIEKSRTDFNLQSWFLQNDLHKSLISKMQDTEGYVKNSTLIALSILVTIPGFRQRVCEEINFAGLVTFYLSEDEAVTRRAVAKALLSWHCEVESGEQLTELANVIFLIMSLDLDWEVKIITVDYWKRIIEQAEEMDKELGEMRNDLEARYSCKVLDFLITKGFADAIIGLATDQDVSVRKRVSTLVQRIQQLQCINSHSAYSEVNEEISDGLVLKNQTEEAGECLEYMRDELKYQAIEKVLDTVDSKIVEEVMVPKPQTVELHASTSSTMDLIKRHHNFNSKRVISSDFVKWAKNCCVEDNVQLTTDLYDNFPEALLDDLLMNYMSETEEEFSLDCY